MVTLTLCALIACLPLGNQAVPKPPYQGPHVRRVCVESLDIHLGDSFEAVSQKISIRPDPNGPNQNSTWVAGAHTDFVSTQGPEYRLADGAGTLRSTIFCTFDDRRRLTQFRLAWHYEGEQTAAARATVLGVLLGEIHTCLDKQAVEVSAGKHVARIDFGTYSQELIFEGGDSGPWQITYTLSDEP